MLDRTSAEGRSMFALLSLTSILAAPVPKDLRPLRNAAPPPEWKLADLSVVLPAPTDPGPMRVLAWRALDTKRGFVLETALVLKELKTDTDADGRFVLAVVYRVPKAEKPAWKLAMTTVERVRPNGVPVLYHEPVVSRTTDPPTEAEVSALLARDGWAEALQPFQNRTPELVAGGVVYANWKAALGRDPPADSFPELKAK